MKPPETDPHVAQSMYNALGRGSANKLDLLAEVSRLEKLVGDLWVALECQALGKPYPRKRLRDPMSKRIPEDIYLLGDSDTSVEILVSVLEEHCGMGEEACGKLRPLSIYYSRDDKTAVSVAREMLACNSTVSLMLCINDLPDAILRFIARSELMEFILYLRENEDELHSMFLRDREDRLAPFHRIDPSDCYFDNYLPRLFSSVAIRALEFDLGFFLLDERVTYYDRKGNYGVDHHLAYSSLSFPREPLFERDINWFDVLSTLKKLEAEIRERYTHIERYVSPFINNPAFL